METSYIAHGKVILIGEHSVVYGYDALAMPIKALRIKTSVKSDHALIMETKLYRGPFYSAPNNYNGLKYVVKTMLAKANKPNAKLRISYTGEIPIERGLGSSATVALGTTKALNKYFNLNLTEEEIMKITNHAEMINHGKASGLDAATVHSDYLVFFNKQTGPKKLEAKLGAKLLIMDTGQLGNTKQAVAQVRQQLQASVTANQKIERLGQLADETKQAWLKQDVNKVGKIFNQAQKILHYFNLSTDKIDELNTIALNQGALGFKLSGGGLGGVVLAICQDENTIENIISESRQIINNYWVEEI